ncbi:MAG: RNA polymerase sigma factor [Erysipelotrichales bacterium]|nr:RNA polymerase sigma factor [Erysipelotrichales bacterium]
MNYVTSSNSTSLINMNTDIDNCIYRMAINDKAALAELYELTKVSIYSFSLSILKNTQDAEDALHDTYLAAYSSASSYKSNGKPLAWLLTITRNICLHKLNELKRIGDLPDEDLDKVLSTNDTVSKEDRMMLESCLKHLGDEERQIVVLHAISGFKHHEIAKLLKLPLPTVLSKYSRALKKLRNMIEKEY